MHMNENLDLNQEFQGTLEGRVTGYTGMQSKGLRLYRLLGNV